MRENDNHTDRCILSVSVIFRRIQWKNGLILRHWPLMKSLKNIIGTVKNYPVYAEGVPYKNIKILFTMNKYYKGVRRVTLTFNKHTG